MRSSQTITLFSDQPELSQRPSSFMLSILAHGGAIGLLTFGAMYAPRMNDRALSERYTVRQLDLQATEPQRRRSAESEIGYPGPQSIEHTPQPDGKSTAQPPVLRQIAPATPGLQTLVQPDLPSHLALTQQIPVPNIVIWAPEKTPVKAIVPPRPDKPTAAEVKPSLEAPNRELNLADVRISATDLAAQKLPILPSTTSPLVVHGPDLPQSPPATTSMSSAEPTPTAVLSLSGLRMTSGTVFLPPANETTSSASQGMPEGDPASKGGGGTGTGKGAGDRSGAKAGPAQGAEAGSGSGDPLSTTHIKLAKDGQFGAVVVGNSLGERYPEAAALLSGRLVYTVYLHLGLAKSWILQYSLPRSDDAAAAGNATSLEAPWPYNIVRPNIPAGAIDADVLMVHGFVNKEGRFEALTVAFPPEFQQAQFVVDALKQWEFRPAMQDGQIARVEVLLIIPLEP